MPSSRRSAPTPEEVAEAFVKVPNTGGPLAVTGDEGTDDDSIEENDIAARVRASLGVSPGDNVRVKLYRRGQFTRKLEWCEDFPPEAVMNGADELIRNTWGAGAYELRVTGSAGTLAKIQIDIAAKPQSAAQQNPAPAPAPAVSDVLAGVLERMADTQAQILARLSAPPPPAAPPLGMAEMLGMLATAKQLFVVPAPPPAAGIVEMAQQMRALKQLGEEFSPPAADPDSPMSMVNGLMGVIGEAIKARSGTQTPALPMPGVQLPSGFDTGTEPAGMASPAPAESAQDQTTRQFLEGVAQGVIQHATENKPAQECANWLAEVLPEEFDPMLKLPNWLDMLCGAMPALEPHRAYLLQVKPLLDAALVG